MWYKQIYTPSLLPLSNESRKTSFKTNALLCFDVCFLQPDRSYDIVIKSPTTTYLLLQAAGIQRGARRPGKL